MFPRKVIVEISAWKSLWTSHQKESIVLNYSPGHVSKIQKLWFGHVRSYLGKNLPACSLTLGRHSHDLLKIIADNQRSICVKNVYVELYSICGECFYPPDWRVYLKIARSQIQSSIIMNHHVLHWTVRGVWIYTKYRSVQSIHNRIISLSSTLYRCFCPISPSHQSIETMFGAGQHATVSMTSRQVLNRVLFLETTCWVDGGVSS